MSLRNEQALATDVPGYVRTSSVGDSSCYRSATGWHRERVILRITLSLARHADLQATEVQLHSFWTGGLYSGQCCPPYRFTLHANTVGFYWTGTGWTDSRAGLDILHNCRCWNRTLYHQDGRLVTIPTELRRFEIPSCIRFRYRRYRCSEGDILCMQASSAVAFRVSDAVEFGASQAVWIDADFLLFESHSCDLSVMWLTGRWPPRSVETCC